MKSTEAKNKEYRNDSRRRGILRRLVTLALAPLTGLTMLAAAGLANAATISVAPSPINVNPGDTFTVTIAGSGFDGTSSTTGLSGTTGGSISVVAWDPSVLTLQTSVLDTVFAAPGLSNSGNDSVAGTLTGVEASTGFAGGITDATFDIGVLTFTVEAGASAGPTDIMLTLARSGVFSPWTDSSGIAALDPQPTVANGIVNIGGGAVVPIPAAAWLFGSGLLGLLAVRRKAIA